MAIPANYTYETFADYLKNEVLLDTAEELSWTDWMTVEELNASVDYPDANEITDVVTVGARAWQFNSTSINLFRDEGWIGLAAGTSATKTLTVPSAYYAPAGTTIVFFTDSDFSPENDDITTLVLDVDLNIGDTTATFTTSTSLTGTGFFYRVMPVPTSPTRRLNPIYEAITDVVLFKMNKTDIASITSVSEKRKLRLFGRREAWGFAMQALAADYNYTSHAGSVNRFELYLHAREMFTYESNRIDSIYGSEVQNVGQLLTSTQRSKVKVRW